MYLIDFDVIALLIALVSLYFFYSKKRIADRRGKRFEMLIVIVTIDAAVGIASSLAINALPGANPHAVIAAVTAFYVTHNSVPMLFAGYIMEVCAWWPPSRAKRAVFYVPWAVAMALTAVNLPTGILFSVDAAGSYVHGPAYTVIYTLTVLYFVLFIASVVRPHSAISRNQRTSFAGAIALAIIAVAVQNVIPGLMLEGFACSLGVLFAFLTIQNTDELIDGQTGLFNREAFFAYAGEAFSRKTPFSVIVAHSRELPSLQEFLDINGYERMLRSFTAWLSRMAGDDYYVCTMGEGLFALVSMGESLREPPGETAITIANKAAEAWKIMSDRFELPVNVCVLQCPKDCAGTNDVMDRIDQLLDIPDRAGNRHVFYATDFVADKKRIDASIAEALERSIQEGTLELRYQPVHSVAEGGTIAVEALLCLRMEDGRLIRQHDVIRIAERIGITQKLATSFLERSLNWYASSDAEKRGVRRLEVRLLESKCLEQDWDASILEILGATGVSPSRLCLEIAESVVANVPNELAHGMERLKAEGVAFALDDFGSGYTDLRAVIDMPFPVVKFDKKIIHTGLTSEKGKRLLAGTARLFRDLGRIIVAEGIETQEQADAVIAMGFDYLQGYRFGKPCGEADIMALLDDEPGADDTPRP